MKKSRIFLGVTAFTLAIASAVAAKAKNAVVTYYYTTGGTTNVCVTQALSAAPDCKIGGTGCFFTVGLIQYQVYESKSNGICATPLQTISAQ